MRAAAAMQHNATISEAIVGARDETVAKTVVAWVGGETAVAKRWTAIATAMATALRNVAIGMGQTESAANATMASAATDRRMQPRVCKITAEIGARGALAELTAPKAGAAARREVAISTGQTEIAATAMMASAATDHRMQFRVCKITAGSEVSGALTELTEGAKEGAKTEVIAVALTESILTARRASAGT